MGAAWPLTGRAEELRIIATVLVDDEPTGVAIAGRAGVGKTRLAREAAAAVSETDWAVRWVVGTATARSIPLGSFAQWTDGVDGSPLRLVHHVISSITSALSDQRVLLVVDDAHLLDDLSAFVLHQLVLQRLATVIATIRAGEPAPDAVTALWKDGHLRRMELQPLSRVESDALTAAALGGPPNAECGSRLWRFTRGNVLFLRQLLEQELNAGRLVDRHGQWHWIGRVTVSPSLMDLVELQIGAVNEPVREVVDLVAVAEPVERACLASLVNAEAIEEAERRGLIAVSSSATSDLVWLGHPLYGELRLEQCGPLRLRRLRGRAAKAMRDLDAACSADPVRLGSLWLDSDLEPDSDIFVRAARAAIARLDLELVERLADAAVRASAAPEAAVLRAHALILLNRASEAEEILIRLSENDLTDATKSNVLNLRAANLLWSLRRPNDSWTVIEQALAHSAGRLTHQLHAFRCIQLAMAARPIEVTVLMSSVDLAQLPALQALVAIWAQVIALGELGRPEQAAALAAEGYPLACNSPYAAYHGVRLAEFHVAAMLLGGLVPQALTVAQSTFLKCGKVPGVSRSVATAVTGMAALGAGNLTTAVRCLQTAIGELSAGADTTGALHRFMIAYTEALAKSGDVNAAQQAHEKMQASRHPSLAFLESDYLLSAAWVSAARGRITQARETALRAAQFTRAHGQLAREAVCLQTATQFGETTVANRLKELADLLEGPRALISARYAQALSDDDADALAAVSLDFEAMGDRLAAADSAAHASLAYVRADHRGAALTASGRARRIAESCGAVSPAILAAQSPLSLTCREREIVNLVSQGLSNKAIAEALTASVRTVEGHIYRVMSRLGVRNRTELSALVKEYDGVEVNPSGAVRSAHLQR
jgi:DNA-binding CsgD family transcriptional regulator